MSNTKHTLGTDAVPCYVWAEIKPQYWYEWGNEKRGMVSTFAYDKCGDYHFTGYYDKRVAIENRLKFLNPHA